MLGFDLGNVPRWLMGGIGGLGVLISIVSNFKTVHQLADENFGLVLFVGWGLASFALIPKAPPRQIRTPSAEPLKGSGLRHYVPIALLSFLCVVAWGWRYWKANVEEVPGKPPEPVIPPKIGESLKALLLGGSAWAAQPPSVKLLQFDLSQGRSSYKAFEPPLPVTAEGNTSGPSVTFKLSPEAVRMRESKECVPGFKARSETARHALRRHLEKTGKREFLMHVEKGNFLELARLQMGGAVPQMLPQGDEWKQLPGADYDAILDWFISCIGVVHPVFVLTLENPLGEPVTVTHARYEIVDIDKSKGVAAEGLTHPQAIYAHHIPGEKGSFCQSLTPALQLPPKQSASFELQLSAPPQAADATYAMRIVIGTSKGSVSTKPFRVSLSGRAADSQLPTALRCRNTR